MPTSTELWTYNTTKHRWIPTILGASEIGDITQLYKDTTTANRILQSISNTVYQWAYQRSNSKNRAYMEYLFAFDLQDVIKDAMLSQVEADLSSGINDLKLQHGLNVETGMMMPNLQQRTLCIEAQEILLGATFIANNMHYNLISQWSWNIVMTSTRYEELNY